MIVLQVRGSAVVVAACDCCERFCGADGGTILHANYCDGGKRSERWTPTATETPATEPVAAQTTINTGLPLNTVGNGAAEDDWHATNSRNPQHWTRALNRDD